MAKELGEKIESKGIIPPNQTGFRKGMGTINNICILNYMINRRIEKKRKLVGLVIDLKAAFDTVDREILIREMREKGVWEELVVRIGELIKETRNRVKIGKRNSERFWTGREVRQGCPVN